MTRERLQVDLLKIRRQARKTIVFITHSVEEATFLATRVLVMSARPGRVILDRRVELPGDTPTGCATRQSWARRSSPPAGKAELSKAIYDAHG